MATENFKTQEELFVAIDALVISDDYKAKLKELSNELKYQGNNVKFYLIEEKDKAKNVIKTIVGQKTTALKFTEFVIDSTYKITKRVSEPNIQVVPSKVVVDPLQNETYFKCHYSITQIFNSEVVV